MKVSALRQVNSPSRLEAMRSVRLLHRLRATRSALREQQKWVDAAATAAHLGMWTYDFASGSIHASRHWCEMLDLWPPTPLEPLDLGRLMQRVDPQDRSCFSNTLVATQSGLGGHTAECRIRLPSGDTRWVAWRGQTEFAPGGRPLRLRGVSIDVTERKLEQESSRQRQQELTHLSRVSMLGGLSGAIAHELNQPLTAVLSNAHAAQRFLARGEADLAEVSEILADIATEGRRAGEIIRRLRALLRPGQGPRSVLNLNDLVLETLDLVSQELQMRHVAVETVLESSLPCVYADRVQLQQVMINLITNACDAMLDTPDAQRRVIVRTAHVPGQDPTVSVADHGAGIPDNILAKVFDSFFTTKSNGMGLGLSVCRSIMFAHDGRIWAEKNSDSGTTFHFSLPSTPSVTAENS